MNILLVDDDRDSRKSIGEFLRDCGHIVYEGSNGEEALEIFHTADFHMVLSDIKMPKLSGIELLREISSLKPEVDVILFTGHSDLATAIEALRAGAYDYLLKPVNIEELAAVIERVAEHQSLRKENKILTESFEAEVMAATQEKEIELTRLKKAYAQVLGLGQIGIFSETMREIYWQALKFHSDRTIPVLIQGETGTGKEVIARYIHYGNMDVTEPFVDLNCATLNHNVFESELFGYEAGAFTGGLTKGQKGKFDLAHGGTLFLDEITELPIELQAKLLRVIQEREFYRVGGLKKIKTDVRIICATNCDLEEKVEEGTFRQDLYYRLNVGRIILPPLRERKEEIIHLADMFLIDFAQKRGKKFNRIGEEATQLLLSHYWPGNIRELKNTMEWVAFMHDGVELKPAHLGILHKVNNNLKGSKQGCAQVLDLKNFSLPKGGLPLEEYTNEIILKALEMHNRNKTHTASYLGITRRSLYSRLEQMKTCPGKVD